MNGRDPGWKPSFSRLWMWVYPPVGFQIGRKKTPGLVFLRSAWLWLPCSWFLFGFVLSFLETESASRNSWLLAMIGIGTLDVVLLLTLRARPLKTASDRETLALAYSQKSMVAYALTNSVVLMGFVGFFVGGGMLTFLVGILFGLAGIALMAPTRSHLELFQRKVREAGGSLSLIEALSEPLPPVPRRRGWPRKGPGRRG